MQSISFQLHRENKTSRHGTNSSSTSNLAWNYSIHLLFLPAFHFIACRIVNGYDMMIIHLCARIWIYRHGNKTFYSDRIQKWIQCWLEREKRKWNKFGKKGAKADNFPSRNEVRTFLLNFFALKTCENIFVSFSPVPEYHFMLNNVFGLWHKYSHSHSLCASTCVVLGKCVVLCILRVNIMMSVDFYFPFYIFLANFSDERCWRKKYIKICILYIINEDGFLWQIIVWQNGDVFVSVVGILVEYYIWMIIYFEEKTGNSNVILSFKCYGFDEMFWLFFWHLEKEKEELNVMENY